MSEQTENTTATGTDPAVAALTDAEKIALTGGADFWHTHGAPSAGLPGVMVTDGPHGLRAGGAGAGPRRRDRCGAGLCQTTPAVPERRQGADD